MAAFGVGKEVTVFAVTEGSSATKMTIARERDTFELELPRETGCNSGTLVRASGSADTWPHRNRKEFIVPTGLIRFVEDDDELAIAIAHQYGHQLLGKFRSIKHEPQADRLGLRIAAAAGFDVSKAPAFWDRWAVEQFWKISDDMDGGYILHGGMSRRGPVIRAEVERIEAEANGGVGQAASRSGPSIVH